MDEDERLPDEVDPKAVAEYEEIKQEDATDTGDEAAPEEEAAQGQEDGDSPEPEEKSDEDEEEKKSAARKRRERRKAQIEELRESERIANEKLERIKGAGEGEAPKEEDFDDLTEFAAARAVWMQTQRMNEREQAAASGEVEAIRARQRQEINRNFEERAAEAATRLEGFDEIARNPSLSVTQAMAETIAEAENGPDVLYALGSDPAEALRISRLPVHKQVFEIGRMSAQLTAPKPKTLSTAPPPIKPVANKAKAQRDPSKMSHEEYRKWRQNGGGR